MADNQNGEPDEDGRLHGEHEKPEDDSGEAFEKKPREVLDRVVEKVQELAPVVGGKIQEGAEMLVRKVREVAPEVGERVQEGAVVVAKKVQEVAPVVGGKVYHGATVLSHKVQEATPVVGGAMSEGAGKAGEVLGDLRKRVADRMEHRAQGSTDGAGPDEHNTSEGSTESGGTSGRPDDSADPPTGGPAE
jgi:hypothetical protein